MCVSVAERWANSTGGRRHKLKVECSSFRLIVGCQHEGLGQAVGGGGGRRGAAGEAIKLVTVMCLSCACHVPAMCLSCNYHVAIMWLSCDYHVTACSPSSCRREIGIQLNLFSAQLHMGEWEYLPSLMQLVDAQNKINKWMGLQSSRTAVSCGPCVQPP